MKWLAQANRILMVAWIPFALMVVLFALIPLPRVEWSKVINGESVILPKGSFVQSKEAYRLIAGPVLSLQFDPLSVQLPDLKNHIVYYGKNWRPDVPVDEEILHIGLKGTGRAAEIKGVLLGKPLYLLHTKVQGVNRYQFSPENAETPLWIEIEPEEEHAIIRVRLQEQSGNIVTEPEDHATFELKERKRPRLGSSSWQMDGVRVDGSLLARQRARWYGEDLFLEKHGGDEFADKMDKQRIQFGSNEKTYVIYVGPESYLVWNEGRWHEANPGPETQGKPLLKVKKIDEKMLQFDLWDGEGKTHLTLNLAKSKEMWRFSGFKKMRFVGARTRSQSIVEISSERVIVGDQEWILFLENSSEWKVLSTIEEIDNYVAGKLRGYLFVSHGIEKQDGRQAFMGHVFNTSRNDMQVIELSTQSEESKIYHPGKDSEDDDGDDSSRESSRGRQQIPSYDLDSLPERIRESLPEGFPESLPQGFPGGMPRGGFNMPNISPTSDSEEDERSRDERDERESGKKVSLRLPRVIRGKVRVL